MRFSKSEFETLQRACSHRIVELRKYLSGEWLTKAERAEDSAELHALQAVAIRLSQEKLFGAPAAPPRAPRHAGEGEI